MILIRPARAADAEAVAELHAESWRRHYRGAYLDSYLDGDVVADRRAVWSERLAEPDADRCTLVAVDDGEVVGFAHLVFDADPTWGSLLDNLHATFLRKRSGIGTRLVSEVARAVIERSPASGLHLWVLEQNTAAQAFYSARWGTCVERAMRGPFPGGGHAQALRFAWPDPTVLVDEPSAGSG
ncbi:MAG TPA: GNAT family N-acetyltransferase [Acidimicrobiales bacterium]|nr:GNAT family N-acetyltransferase [Acidimicrobiales bacterium]